MAPFALRSALEETLVKLDSFVLTDQSIIIFNLRAELLRFVELLRQLHNLLPDLDERFVELYNVSYRLIKLKQVVYQAEDITHELAFEILRPKVTKTHFNFLKKLIFNLKLAHKVRILNQSVSDVKDEFRLPLEYHFRMTIRFDMFRDYPIVGREDDASKVVNLMTCSCSDKQQQVLTVVAIVGMGGLGKTTLAKLVSRRAMALDLFDVKMWVCVADKCDEVEILGQMLRSLGAKMAGSVSLTDKGAIFKHLEKELAGKSFILVLDDVWGDVGVWWDDFRARLLKMCTNNGNVVFVTTRSEEVASAVETSPQHRHTLDFLSDDDCWFILKETAFKNVPEDSLVLSNLEAIGREIAIKCRGVPLAAKVLGGTLGVNRDERTWLRIRDSCYCLKSRNEQENVESILKLTFDHLSSLLKPCFALCSVFPKGYLIMKEDLIQVWITERFVDSCDMGNQYFHDLLENSFFQDAEKDDDGNVINCKMHNLVHDLALSLEKSKISIHCLYADNHYISTSEALHKDKAKYLHTIIFNGAPFQTSWNSKRSQTLYLNGVDIVNLSSSVSKLKHFRFLHVSNTKIGALLKSIAKIYMLQSLTLTNCSCERLPFLGDLPFLKLLKISHMERLKCIGNESYEGVMSQHELTHFPTLKSLSLSWMETLTEWKHPSHCNMVVFPRLENLSIQCCAKLTGFPMRDLSGLGKIEIKDCEELRFIFDEKESFPSITSLSIVGCPKLTHLRNWLLSNMSYEEFKVRRCEWLRFIPDDLGTQRSLVSLQIYCCKGLGFFSEEILCKLTQLRKLSIGAFSEKLDDFCYLNRIGDLRYLEELEIWGSDVFGRKMYVLPVQLQQLASLCSLKIKGFTLMEALPEWLRNLRFLENISLHYCWHLEPQSIAAIIQHPSYISNVYVYGCHEKHKSQWMEFSGITTRIRLL